MTSPERPPRLAVTLYGIYVLVCLAALIWPVYAWADTTFEARPLGLPFCFAWNVFWVLASFVTLFLFDRAARRGAPW